MNREELKIYTLLTHLTSPESYRISDDGTKLYVMEWGILVCLEGEGLNEMSPQALYHWYLRAIREWQQQQH